jgi:hypothetical protein
MQQQREIMLLTAGLHWDNSTRIACNYNTIGVTYPMADRAILTASEVALKTATDAYNVKIGCTAKGLAFVNCYARVKKRTKTPTTFLSR